MTAVAVIENVVREMIDLSEVAAVHPAIAIETKNVLVLQKMNAHPGVNIGAAEVIESREILIDIQEENLLQAETY